MGMRPSATIIVGLPTEQDDDCNQMLTFNGKEFEDAFEDSWDGVEVDVPKFGKVTIDSFYAGDEIVGVGVKVARWDWDDIGDEVDLFTLNVEARGLTQPVCYALGELGVPKEMIEKVKTFIVVEFS